MIYNAYAVFDSVSESWHLPFYNLEDISANHDFKISCINMCLTSPANSVFVSNYELYRLGTYNTEDSSFEFEKHPVLIDVMSAEYVKSTIKKVNEIHGGEGSYDED